MGPIPSALGPIRILAHGSKGPTRKEVDNFESLETDDIYSWLHNGRCGNIIYVCRYESVTASSVQAHDTTWFGHAMFDRHVYVVNVIEYIETVNTHRTCSSESIPVVCRF